MNKTKIEWTEKTWNPITGCTEYSSGCKNCYAKKMANRLFHMKNPRYVNNFQITCHNDLIDKPLTIKIPSIIFVCSMSDIFHEEVPTEFIDEVFKTMSLASWHIFQVLTKRTERMVEYLKGKDIPANIWIGTTVEEEKTVYRINLLKTINAKTKFLSCEPLLSKLESADFSGIDWVVVGGESGANARPVDIDWIRDIRDKCKKENVPFFFKQWGGWNKKKNGHLLDGVEYKEMPNKVF